MGAGSSKTVFIGVLCVIAVAIGMTAGNWRRSPPAAAEAARPAESAPATEIEVHVAGWVVSPGVVTVPAEAIVAQAIDAAGGMRPGAQAELINLAAPLTSGEQVVVPGPDPGRGGVAATSTGLLSLNQAAAADLEALPGVGPVLAERIVAFREDHGRFEVVEDLLEVPGIGEAKLSSIRDLVRP
jgi:competence protein ComEA